MVIFNLVTIPMLALALAVVFVVGGASPLAALWAGALVAGVADLAYRALRRSDAHTGVARFIVPSGGGQLFFVPLWIIALVLIPLQAAGAFDGVLRPAKKLRGDAAGAIRTSTASGDFRAVCEQAAGRPSICRCAASNASPYVRGIAKQAGGYWTWGAEWAGAPVEVKELLADKYESCASMFDRLAGASEEHALCIADLIVGSSSDDVFLVDTASMGRARSTCMGAARAGAGPLPSEPAPAASAPDDDGRQARLAACCRRLGGTPTNDGCADGDELRYQLCEQTGGARDVLVTKDCCALCGGRIDGKLCGGGLEDACFDRCLKATNAN